MLAQEALLMAVEVEDCAVYEPMVSVAVGESSAILLALSLSLSLLMHLLQVDRGCSGMTSVSSMALGERRPGRSLGDAGEPWPAAATPMDNPYRSCKPTRVLRAGAAALLVQAARRQDGVPAGQSFEHVFSPEHSKARQGKARLSRSKTAL